MNQRIKFWLPVILWIMYFSSFVMLLYFVEEHKEDHLANKLDKIKIYDFKRKNYSEWERDKAIEFGFNQLTTTINYLFIAAGALLGFIGKNVIDPIIEDENTNHLSPTVLALLKHSAIACVLSVFFGFYARSFFNNIGDKEKFTIYDDVGISSFYQLLSFFLAAVLITIAVTVIANKKIFGTESENKTIEESK